MLEKIIKIKGEKKGPVSIILAGVHGNEKCGINALKEMLPKIKLERGIVFFGFGNPQAIKKNKRFIETDLNRMFKDSNMISKKNKASYEYKRAQFLKKYLNQSDALLDIHASFTPKSKPFIICEKNSKKIVSYFPFNLIVSGFDKTQPGGTDFYMNSIGKVGICIECGYLNNASSLLVAKKSIFAFLKARGHIKNNLSPRKKSYIQIYKLYLTKTNAFTLSKKFKDFEKIKKENLIGIDGNTEIRASKDSVILFARNSEEIGGEAFLLGEKRSCIV